MDPWYPASPNLSDNIGIKPLKDVKCVGGWVGVAYPVFPRLLGSADPMVLFCLKTTRTLIVLVDRKTDGLQDEISPDIKKFFWNGKGISRN